MTLESTVPASATDAGGYLAIDVPCRQCAYNLRGLLNTGRCPECGIPVAISVHGDLLCFSRPQWLFGLRRGANLIITGVALMILGFIVTVAVRDILILGPLVFILAGGCNLAGSWLLTAPDPSGLGEDKYGTARKIIRVSLIVGLAQQVINLFPGALGRAQELFVLWAVVGIVAGIIGVIGQFALLSYLSKIAMRIPDEQLSGRARFLMYAIGISYGLLVLGGLVAVLTGPSSALIAAGCFMSIVGLALLVFGIMYLLMLERLGKVFKAQAVLAQELWASLDAKASS